MQTSNRKRKNKFYSNGERKRIRRGGRRYQGSIPFFIYKQYKIKANIIYNPENQQNEVSLAADVDGPNTILQGTQDTPVLNNDAGKIQI